jgi:hypothetical protein
MALSSSWWIPLANERRAIKNPTVIREYNVLQPKRPPLGRAREGLPALRGSTTHGTRHKMQGYLDLRQPPLRWRLLKSIAGRVHDRVCDEKVMLFATVLWDH